jgi:uncharacterized protein (DUF58 family)
MKLERDGQAAALVAIALFVSAVVFRDFFVETALLVLLMIMASEAAWVRIATRKLETKFVLTREDSALEEHKVTLYPGKQSVERVRLDKKVGGEVEFESRVSFLEIEPKAVRRTGVSVLEFKFSTDYAGEYSGDQIGLVVKGPLGFFLSRCTIPFSLKYVVYPRVLQVASATVKLLGRAEVGGAPIDIPGLGSEYYEMREYQAGDDYRSVNWKATARLGELMVVEHMREAGGSYLLVLDARAPGFREIDELASTFLSLANSLGAAAASFGVLVHDGKSVLEMSSEQDPRASTTAALRAAVRMVRLETSPEFLELVPVRIAMAPIALGAESNAETVLSAMARLRKEEMSSTLERTNPWGAAERVVRETQTRSILYVSGLFGDARPVIELAWEARHHRDAEFTVANPCDTGGAHKRYHKVSEALQVAGASYRRGDPGGLLERILVQ